MGEWEAAGAYKRYPERYAALDLRRLSTPGNPPTLILAGKNDPLLPAASVEDFARRSTAAGNAVDLVMLPYSGHNFNTTFNSITNQLSIATITRFMNRYSRVPKSVARRSIRPPNGVGGRQCSVSATTSNS
ncbi:alpha/beta hydrolase [Sphingomonas sp. M6A6_1c]